MLGFCSVPLSASLRLSIPAWKWELWNNLENWALASPCCTENILDVFFSFISCILKNNFAYIYKKIAMIWVKSTLSMGTIDTFIILILPFFELCKALCSFRLQKLFKKYTYMDVLPTCTSVNYLRSEEGIWSPGTEVTERCEFPRVSWEVNIFYKSSKCAKLLSCLSP